MIDKIKGIFVKKEEEKLDKITIFIGLVESYLKREHPNIVFDLSFYQKLKEEADTQNEQVEKTLIIREVVKQFSDFIWEKTTQKSLKKDLIWDGYGINSQPNKKVPIDFSRRKELVFFREEGVCNRCGHIIEKIERAYIVLAQSFEQNGGYNLENLILLCQNCHSTTTYNSSNFSEVYLKLREDLYDML